MKPTFLLALALAAQAATSIAEPTAYSSSGVSYLYGAPAATVLFESNRSGATTERSISASTASNGVESAYARASLQDGSLKAAAGGTADRINGGATAVIGDTFGAIDAATGASHSWQAGEQVSFTFAVTGTYQQSMISSDFAALDPRFTSLVNFGVGIYRPGFFERQARIVELQQLPYTDEVAAEWSRLADEQAALSIASSFQWLGRPYSPYWDGAQANWVGVDPSTPTLLSISFAPGGDFEWIATLDVTARFQPETPLAERPTFIIDYAHSVGASFSGPAGTLTTSASGYFPGTVAMNAAAVPEPGSWLLCLSGLAVLGLAKRRGRRWGSGRNDDAAA